MKVRSFSKQTRKQADELLEQGKVIDILSKYRKVVVTGSYKYNLMYGPDIDLVVLSEDSVNRHCIGVLNENKSFD